MSYEPTTSTIDLPLRVPPLCHIAGEWRRPTAATFPVTDQADDARLADVPDVTAAVADEVLAGAWRGFRSWSAVPARERADVLRRAYDLVEERSDELALLISLEMGKPRADALAEVAYSNGFLREYAELATRIEGRHAFHEATGGRILTQSDPVGPCLFVTPWNFPLAMGARKIAPALAAGCSAIVKPPHQTPLTMLAFVGILLEAGVHPEAVSVVTTTDPGDLIAAMIDDPRLAKLSFTGSTGVGRALAEHGGRRLLRMSMELGGNAPFLVFADADLDEALRAATVAKFRNGGQACTSANRFLVDERIAPAFVAGLVAIAEGLTLGPAADPASRLGPLIDDRAAAKVHDLVNDATGRGASIATGGPRHAHGRYYPATVLTDVPRDARILREEVFGPVAPVSTFSSEAEAIERANDTEYGLAAYAFTNDASRLLRLSRQLEVGMVGINTGLVSNAAAPFGGIKASGFGREGGPEGLAEYLQTRYVAIPDPRS